jgi:tetratricopeptide (TPR) repeat protein
MTDSPNANTRNSIARPVLGALFAAAVALAAAPALAAGGGGGGGGELPSTTAREIDVGKRYQDGVTALQAKNFSVAQKAFKDVLSVAPRDPNANLMMGLTLVGLDRYKDARRYLRTSVKANPDGALARGWLGLAEARTGDHKKADAEKAALAALKAKCGACADAKTIDEAIARIEGEYVKPAAALPAIHATMQLVSADQGDSAYLSAYGLINEGRYEEGLAELGAAGLAFGPHPDVLTYQGFANRKLGRLDVAVSYYRAALKLQPEHRGANEYLGEFYVETGQMAKAQVQLAKLERICVFGCEEAEELRRRIDTAS